VVWSLTLWCPLLPYGYSYKSILCQTGLSQDCNSWHLGTLTFSHKRQCARMSKITNDGLTRSGTRCFIAVPICRVPTLLLTKSRTFPSQDPTKNFPPVWSLQRACKEKMAFTYDNQSELRQQNPSTFHTVFKEALVNTNLVLHYCCLFSIWTTTKMHDFQGYFSRTFQDQSDFPGTSRCWILQEKFQNFPGLSRGHGNPAYGNSVIKWLITLLVA